MCLMLIILIGWSRNPLLALLIWWSRHNLFISVIYSGYDYQAGYRLKIKLICRLTKDRDPALILISITLEFLARNFFRDISVIIIRNYKENVFWCWLYIIKKMINIKEKTWDRFVDDSLIMYPSSLQIRVKYFL